METWRNNLLRSLSIFLIVTAIGKAYLLLTNPFADLWGGGFPIQLLWLSVFVELVIGWATWSRRPNALLWLVYGGFFLAVFALSGIRWLVGYRSCRCFGVVDVPILFTVALDFVILLLLLWMRPTKQQLQRAIMEFILWLRKADAQRSGFLFGTAICLLLVVVSAIPLVSEKMERLFGSTLVASQTVVLDDLMLGRSMLVDVEIENFTNLETRIKGTRSSCTCVLMGQHDGLLKPQGSTMLPVRIRPTKSGRWHQRIECFLDHPDQTSVMIDLIGYVQKSRS